MTVSQYAAFRAENLEIVDPELPICNVALSDASQYCNWLSQLDGFPEEQWCYQRDDSKQKNWILKPNAHELKGYRLPTLEEFELVAQYSALEDNPTSSLIQTVSWTKENSNLQIHSVARKPPNSLGLFDLLGNVEEWVHPNTNPISTQDETALTGILAGGGIWLSSDYLSAGYHRTERADFKSPYVGFRVMRAARP